MTGALLFATVLAFDPMGRVGSLKGAGTDRELVRAPRSFVAVRTARGHLPVRGFSQTDENLIWRFDGGDVALTRKPFAGGISFQLAHCTVTGATELVLGDLAPVCTNYVGVYANMLSDEGSCVCLRAYDLPLAMRVDRGSMRLFCVARPPFAAVRFGVAAQPRPKIQAALQAMTLAAGVPVNRQGGAWSLGAEANRRSYLQPQLKFSALDRWIDYAERGGFATIHLRRWMETLGHYAPKRDLFPNGWDDVYAAAQRIHAAGLAAGIHTLTGCISPQDAWTASALNSNYLAWCSYTLAKPLTPEATELEALEAPKVTHDVVFTYMGNGNALRLGNEIVQYSGFSKSPPYRYTGLTRGAFGTTAAAHAAGASVDYLQQRYLAFYPAPASPLADALARQLSGFVNRGAFDQVYFDGSEGMMGEYNTAWMRRRLFGAIGRDITVESSCGGAHNWWYQSRDGAWDGASFDYKPFVDRHLAHMAECRKANLLEPQLGWWLFRPQWLQNRGQFTDDVEYFAAHVAGHDAAMSFEQLDLNDGPPSLYRANAFTVLGWYERFRLARAFRSGVAAAFREPGAEFRLRQDDRGRWQVARVAFAEVMPTVHAGESCAWTLAADGGRVLEYRLEPLYSNRPHGSSDALTVFAGTTNGVALSAARGVCATMRTEEGAHGPALRMTARREAAPQHGSWVKAHRAYVKYFAPRGNRGIGLWVKGDGSGAVLDVQFRMPRELGRTTADHFFKIDFTGWRYLETSIRERMAAEAYRWTWDEPLTGYARHLSEMNMLHLADVNVYLNNLPSNGTVDVSISDVRMLRTFDAVFSDAALTVNGMADQVPFALTSGEYATREARRWRKWDVKGSLVQEVPALPLMLQAGNNRLSFAVTPPADATARARLCTFVADDLGLALKDDLAAESRRMMAYEADLFDLYDPSCGCVALSPVRMRPGEKAHVAFELVGPIRNPVLTVGTQRIPFRSLAKGEEFRLSVPGVWQGVQPVSLTGENAHCRIGAVKRYVTQQATFASSGPKNGNLTERCTSR